MVFGNFLNRNKYEQIPIYRKDAAGTMFADKDGNWNFLVTSPVEPGGEMRFYAIIKEISHVEDKPTDSADSLK